jgi:hypothetical protein
MRASLGMEYLERKGWIGSMGHLPTRVLVLVSIKWDCSLHPVKNPTTLCAKPNRINNLESRLALFINLFLEKSAAI